MATMNACLGLTSKYIMKNSWEGIWHEIQNIYFICISVMRFGSVVNVRVAECAGSYQIVSANTSEKQGLM